MNESLDDVSLRDFEPPLSPDSLRQSMEPSEPATTEAGDDSEVEEGGKHLLDSEIGSVGGYSPPAWRRLGNGDRSSGFWKGPADALGALPVPFRTAFRETSPYDDDIDRYGEDDMVLERAIRTRLPPGSQSPERTRHNSPEKVDDITLRVNNQRSPSVECQTPDERPYEEKNCECADGFSCAAFVLMLLRHPLRCSRRSPATH